MHRIKRCTNLAVCTLTREIAFALGFGVTKKQFHIKHLCYLKHPKLETHTPLLETPFFGTRALYHAMVLCVILGFEGRRKVEMIQGLHRF